MKFSSRNNLLPTTVSALALISLAGCGGSGSSSSPSTTTVANNGIKYGGHSLAAAQQPTADLTLAQVQGIPVGTVLAISLDRNNPSPTYYTATVMGYDALDQLLWLRLTSDVTTPTGEGDSGTPVSVLPTTFAPTSANQALNGKLVGALSYGSTDNQTDFFVTPVSMMRQTQGTTPAAAKSLASTISFKGQQFKRLSTPIYYSGLPSLVLNHMKQRAPSTSLIQNLIPRPVISGSSSSSQPASKATDATSPYGNNTIATFLIRGDVVFEGAVGSVTAVDGSGWLGYGHPLDGAGSVELATCSATVVNMFSEPVNGTYKLANPTNVFDKTMTWDGLNAVRVVKQTPKEVTLTTVLNGSPSKTYTHYLGYDGVSGDQTEFLTATIESSYMAMYDSEQDIQGSASVTVQTTINGKSSSSVFEVPADAGGVFFGVDPNDPTAEPLDFELLELMSNVEASGDRAATVKVTATIKLGS